MTEEQYNINRSYELAVRNLNSKAWEIMLPSEKIGDLQAIENKNAMDQGRIACEVRAEPMEQGAWGYQQGNEIVVNSNELNNPNFMEHVDTLCHEGSHARDWQATFIPEVRSEYTTEQLQAVNSPIPDPDIDPNGYWNHPAEVAAREAGARGVEKTLSDQEQIAQVDRANHTLINQILETYDYIALEPTDTPVTEPAQAQTPDVETTVEATSEVGTSSEVGQSEDMSAGVELSDGEDQGKGYGY